MTDKRVLKRNQKYQDENLEKIQFKVLKRWNLKGIIAQAATDNDTNSRQYILNAIFKQLKEDGYDITAIEDENKAD